MKQRESWRNLGGFCWFLAAMLLCAGAGAQAAEHPTGCIPDSPQTPRLTGVSVEKVSARKFPQATLPSKVKNYRYLPAVRNQLLNNCGAFAPTYYYKTYQEAREHGWLRPDPSKDPQHVMSPGFTFPLTNGGKNAGANINFVMQVMCRYGCADWKTMPEAGDYIAYPAEAAWRNAIPYRGASVQEFDLSTTASQAAFKEHLAGGDLGVIAVLLYHDTYDNYPHSGTGFDPASGVIYANGSFISDWHALTIIGYDDNKAYTENGVKRKGAFLVVNSWGEGWGVVDSDVGTAGFGWLSYDYVMNRRGSMAGGACAMTDRIAYKPTEFAVLDMAIQRRQYLNMWIYPGSAGNMLAKAIEAFPYGGGAEPFAGRIVLDLTEFAALNPYCYTLSAYDLSSYFDNPMGAKTGGVTGLTIEKAGGMKIKAAATYSDPSEIDAGVRSAIHAGPLLPAVCGLNDLTTMALRVAWGDWNRDGKPDLGVAGGNSSFSKMVRTYRNIEILSSTLQNLNSPSPSTDFVTSIVTWGDYDNDGFPDLAVGGQILTGYNYTPAIKIYHNLQSGKFADSGIVLPAVGVSGMAWGDYNNDGRIDLAFCGADASGNAVTKIYKNNGGGKFSDSGVALPQMKQVALSFADMNNDGWLDLAIGNLIYKNNGKAGTFTKAATLPDGHDSAHAWGDYNGDGLLDLAYSRMTDNYGGQREFSAIFRNNGNFSFTDISAGLKGVWSGALAWGDFDNDGLLDLALAGYPDDTWTSKTTRLYRQATAGKFQDTGADLVPVGGGSVAWADLNQDGALDLLVTGHTLDQPGDGYFQGVTQFYSGQATRHDGMNKPNAPPTAPTGLTVTWDAAQQLATFKWLKPYDARTPNKALGYRVRIGTWPGASDVLSPHGDINLTGPHPYAMLPSGPGRLFAGLKPGHYFWSVQAIDGGMALSPWSAEQSFTLGTSGLVSGDVNRDGKLDVADVILATLMAQGTKTALPQYADMDGNGKVDSLDAFAIARKVIGADGEAYLGLASKDIGSAGGTLGTTAQGVQLVVPASSFSNAAKVTLEASSGGAGPATVPLSWRVRGLPIDFKAPLKLRLRDIRPNTALTPFVQIEVPGFSSTLGGKATSIIKRQATVVSGGWLEVTLEEPGALSAGEARELNMAEFKPEAPRQGDAIDPLAGYDYTFVIHLLADSQWRYDGGHFRVVAPIIYKDRLPDIVTDLEDAYAYYTATLGFDLSRRNWTRYPLEVTVMDLGVGSTGEPVNAYTVMAMSYNGISMQLNQQIVNSATTRRTTLAHEFFHVVQALYDSRNRVARATTSPDLWLDEATATYLEAHFAPKGYQSDVFAAYKFMIFGGYEQAERFWGSTSQNYGYGATSLINNLVQMNHNDPKIIKAIYDKKRGGMKGLYALMQSAPGYPLNTWFTSMFERMVEEQIYPGMISPALLKNDVAGKNRTLTLKTEFQRGGHLPVTHMSDLSANLSFLLFDDPLLGVKSGDMLGFQLKTEEPESHNLAVLSMDRSTGKNVFKKLGDATYDSQRKALRLVMPNAINYIKKTSWLIPIVCNTDDTLPYDTKIDSTLYFGVFQDYLNKVIDPHKNKLGHIYWGLDEFQWPTITQTGKFSASDVTMLMEDYKTLSSPNEIPGMHIFLWGEPNEPMPVQITATLDTNSYSGMTSDGLYQVVLTADKTMEYKINKLRAWRVGGYQLRMELISEGPWQSNGNFTMTMNDGDEMNWYDMDVRFGYNMKVYDTQNNNALILNLDSKRQSSAFYIDLERD